MASVLYLIPLPLSDDSPHLFEAYTLPYIYKCNVFFVERERTVRRFIKKLDPNFPIDDFEWISINDPQHQQQALPLFITYLKTNKIIGLMSEAGCPAIADPGNVFVKAAHQYQVMVFPLIGANSIVLSLMASGLNGQQFCFHGYLPINKEDRKDKLKQIEQEINRKGDTHIFIETPYRNLVLIESIINYCAATLLLCIASNLQSPTEWIYTKSIEEWKKNISLIEKKPMIFLLGK